MRIQYKIEKIKNDPETSGYMWLPIHRAELDVKQMTSTMPLLYEDEILQLFIDPKAKRVRSSDSIKYEASVGQKETKDFG